MTRAPIVLLTDFGLADGYPGVMKGVIYSFSPEVPIIDLSHGVPAHHLGSAAFLLWKSYRYFPKNSIFIVVVDPGVGSSRRILYLRWEDWHFLAPDNGVLSPFLQEREHVLDLREVTQSDLFLARRGHTFDGRDRFAPVAAHLARGFRPDDMGPWLESPTVIEELLPRVKMTSLKIVGQVVYTDIYGNLITTVEEDDLSTWSGGRPAIVRVQNQSIPIVQCYSEVEPGKPLAVVGGFGTLEIAVNQGNAQRTLGVPVGQTVEVIPSVT